MGLAKQKLPVQIAHFDRVQINLGRLPGEREGGREGGREGEEGEERGRELVGVGARKSL